MSAPQVEPPFAVRLPGPGGDRPSWIKVGVIAVVGFAVGIVWPRVFGVKLGPSAPETNHAAGPVAPSASAATQRPAAVVAASALPSAAAAPQTPPAPLANVTFGHGFVLSCKGADGEVHKGAGACGAVPPGLEALAQPRLKKLAECPAAAGAAGKLAVVVAADFEANRIAVEPGKATTIGSADALLGCVRAAFQGASLAGIDHQPARVTVLYTLAVAPLPGAAPSGSAAAAPADEPGTAQVAWPVAIVRDAPKTGQVIARLHRGTKIKVGQAKEGWYTIQYGNDFGHEGWVYREAIGK